MTDFEGIKEIVNQVDVQAEMAVMMVFRDRDTGSWLATTKTSERHKGRDMNDLIQEKPKFYWDAQDRYVKLLNVELEVTNILETRAYKIGDEEKVSFIINWLDWECLLLIKNHTRRKREM